VVDAAKATPTFDSRLTSPRTPVRADNSESGI
jgi:hypothetical protein